MLEIIERSGNIGKRMRRNAQRPNRRHTYEEKPYKEAKSKAHQAQPKPLIKKRDIPWPQQRNSGRRHVRDKPHEQNAKEKPKLS